MNSGEPAELHGAWQLTGALNQHPVVPATDDTARPLEVNRLNVCIRCGTCCSRNRIRVSLRDAHRIADGMELTWDVFSRDYLDKHWPDDTSFLLRQTKDGCVFMAFEGARKIRCAIELFKPLTCLEWNPSLYRRECSMGLSRNWGLTLGASGQLVGPEDRLQEFGCFLASLTCEAMGAGVAEGEGSPKETTGPGR